MTTCTDIANLLVATFRNGNKVLICGNGGSAAQASHFAAELVGRFKKDRPPLPAISLCSDIATITAIGNDYGFEKIFSRQVQALGNPGDVLIALSTSGKSPNIIAAINRAKRNEIIPVAFCGANGSQMWVRHTLCSSSTDTAQIQEQHLQDIHAICADVEARMFP